MAIAAYQQAASQINRYPDGSQSALREAIGETYNLNPERIICGNGSDELILLMARAYVGDGQEALEGGGGPLEEHRANIPPRQGHQDVSWTATLNRDQHRTS